MAIIISQKKDASIFWFWIFEKMKIYTKTGDKGDTSLAMGGRVRKSDPRVELYGTADELNSILGIANAFIEEAAAPPPNEKIPEIRDQLQKIQNLLFELGSELAGFRKKDAQGNFLPILLDSDVRNLEEKMDEWQAVLPPLKNFVLPGGTKPASFLHQARTVCRRLERKMVEEKDRGLEIPDLSLIFINRLSDFLFLAARLVNHILQSDEPIWTSRAKKP